MLKKALPLLFAANFILSFTALAQLHEAPNGDIGIGTEFPTATLEVVGHVKLSGMLVNETNVGNTSIRLRPAPSNTATISGIFEAYEKADIGNSGSVLFGMANTNWAAPLSSLVIMSTRQGTGVTKDIMMWAHDSPSATNSALCIKANSNNIGIGTTNPGPYKLAVEGTLGARKVKVTQVAPWADFVFDAAYALPTLKEVEQHIKANKHLPGIPSAKEITKDGLDLGDMQQKQMQKIEELTLYIIELNKKLEEQGKQLEALMKKK